MVKKGGSYMKRKMTMIASSFLIFTTFFLFFGQSLVSAKKPSTKELVSLYEQFESVSHIDDGFMIQDIGRWMLWGLVKIISMLNDHMEGAVGKLVGVEGFYKSDVMDEIMDVVVPLAFGLFVISLLFLGFQFMMNKIEKREEILLNVTLAVAVIVIIPVLVTQMHNVLGFAKGYSDSLTPSLSGSIVQSNVVDLYYYANNNFEVDSDGIGNESTPPLPQSKTDKSKGTTDYRYANKLSKSNAISEMEITETLDINESWYGSAKDKWAKNLKDDNRKAYEFLKHKKLPTGDGESTKMKLHKNVIPGTTIGKEAYYRYHVNWGTVIFTLGVTTFALAITIIKVGRMMFDIVFTQFFAMFVAVTDLTGGQRTKKVLLELANSFGVMFIMVFIMQLFIFYANWVNDLQIGFIPTILMLIAGAWALMDAPDIVQRMMGIDAGLRSGYGALMGAYAGVGLASKGGNMLKGLASKGASAGAGLAGMAVGGLGSGKGKDSSQPKMPNGGGKPPTGGGDGSPDNSFSIPINEKEDKTPDMAKNNGEDAKKIPSDNKSQKSSPVLDKNEQGAVSSGYGSGGLGSVGGTDDAIPNMSEQREPYDLSGSQEVQKSSGGVSAQGEIPPTDHSQLGGGMSSQGMEQIMDRLDGMQNQVSGIQREVGGYSGMAGGVVTGSRWFNRLNHSFQRGQATGGFLKNQAIKGSAKRNLRMNRAGQVVRGIGSSVANSRVGQSVARSTPVQAIGSAGNAVANTVRSLGQSTSQKAQQMTQGVGNAVQSVKNMGGQAVAQVGMKVHDVQETIAGSAPVQAVSSAGSAMAGSVKQIGQTTRNVASSGMAHAGMKVHQTQQTIGRAVQTVQRVGGQGAMNAGMKVHQTQQSVGKAVQTVQRVGGQGAMSAGMKVHNIQTNVNEKINTIVQGGSGSVSSSNTSNVVHRTSGTGASSQPIKDVGSTQSAKKTPRVQKIKEVRNETVQRTKNIRQKDSVRKDNDIRDE